MNPPRPNPRRQAALLSFLRWAALLVIAFVLLLLGYSVYVNVINRAPAEVAPVEHGPAVATVYGTFTITAANALTLFAQNAGYLHTDPHLISVVTSQGAAVKAGQLMATVRDENVERLAKQAQADFDSAVSRLNNGPASAGALKSAQDQVDAYAKLPGNAVPLVTRQAATNQLNVVKTAVENEKLELQRLRDASANVLKTYQDQLDRTRILAPFDGIVTVVNFNDNAYVLPNQALFTVATSETFVSGLVNEEDVGALQVGMKAELHLYSAASKNYIASITLIPPTPDTNSSRYYVYLDVDERPRPQFLYGLTGDMLITVGRKENALVVPARAVNVDQVFIVEDGVVKQRTVKIGFKSADYAEIVSGLNEGDMVIVEDQDAFSPGQRVRPVTVKNTKAKNKPICRVPPAAFCLHPSSFILHPFRLRPALHIGLRFTVSRKRSLLFSLLGVIFGVAFFICTQAQTQGFQQYFIKTILGTSGAIVISDRFQERYTAFNTANEGKLLGGQQRRKYYEGITDAAEIMRVARQFSNVIACAPVVLGNVTARGDFQTEVVNLQGIDLDQHLRATALGEQIIAGKIENYRIRPDGLILGSLLADKMQLKVGDNVTLIGNGTQRKVMNLCAIFRSGNNIIDERRGYVNMRLAQSLLEKPSMVSQIIVTLRDPDRAPSLAEHFERLFGHRSRSWQEREAGNLQVFSVLRLSAGITVSLIILLAGVLIFNTLTMTVLDKVREIAILRSMGYRRFDITVIFVYQGFIIALLGSLLGAGFGALITYGLSQIPVKVRGILYTDRFIVAWRPEHYYYAAMIAFVAVLTASYFPARRAANLAPVDILRGSGQ